MGHGENMKNISDSYMKKFSLEMEIEVIRYILKHTKSPEYLMSYLTQIISYIKREVK